MSDFTAKRVTRKYKQTINAPPDIVFPLLCPVKESEWLEDWRYKLFYSDSGYAEENCVFASQDPGEDDTIWTVTKRDSVSHEIEFVYFIPGIRVTRLLISVKEESGGKSSVYITYIHTPISEEGNRYTEKHNSQEAFTRQMKHWEDSMNYYLETGRMLITN